MKKSSALNSVKIHHNEEFIYFPHDDQYNIIEVDGTRIRDKEDNSPDQIAVQTGLDFPAGSDKLFACHTA